MSLYKNALVEYTDMINGNTQNLKTWDFVRTQLNFVKFRNRAVLAEGNPHIPVKIVLMEYAYNKEIEANLRNPEFMNYLRNMLVGSLPNVTIYTRQKIVNGNTPDFTKRQLVMKFNTPPPPPPPIEVLDIEESSVEDQC